MKSRLVFGILMLSAGLAAAQGKMGEKLRKAITNADLGEAYAQAEARRKYRALLQAEINLIEGQIQEAQKRVEMGVLSPNGPEMVGLKRTFLELQRRLVVFDPGGLSIPDPASNRERPSKTPDKP